MYNRVESILNEEKLLREKTKKAGRSTAPCFSIIPDLDRKLEERGLALSRVSFT